MRPRLFAPEVPIPPDLQPAVEAWLAYKRERRESYKPLGFQALLARMAEWGGERAMAAVTWSMSNNWAGLFEEKKSSRAEEEPFCTPEQLAHVKRLVSMRTEGPEPARSLAYYRKVFESLEPEAFEPGYVAYVEDAYKRRKTE